MPEYIIYQKLQYSFPKAIFDWHIVCVCVPMYVCIVCTQSVWVHMPM